MKKRVLSMLLALVMVLSISGAAFAASTVDLSKYAGTYAIKQGTTTVAKLTIKYASSKLSVSADSKTWYALTKKTGTTFTAAKINVTIQFLSTSSLKYTQKGLVTVTLNGTKIASPKPVAKALTEKDYVGVYAIEGYPIKETIKYENGVLSMSQDGVSYYDLQKDSAGKYHVKLAPDQKIEFIDATHMKLTAQGMTLKGTKEK